MNDLAQHCAIHIEIPHALTNARNCLVFSKSEKKRAEPVTLPHSTGHKARTPGLRTAATIVNAAPDGIGPVQKVEGAKELRRQAKNAPLNRRPMDRAKSVAGICLSDSARHSRCHHCVQSLRDHVVNDVRAVLKTCSELAIHGELDTGITLELEQLAFGS
jgi:hypothetical protein